MWGFFSYFFRIFFMLEYLLFLYISDDRKKFIFSYKSINKCLSCFPFLILKTFGDDDIFHINFEDSLVKLFEMLVLLRISSFDKYKFFISVSFLDVFINKILGFRDY